MDSPTRYAGVDWASRAHAICVVDEHGTALERFEVEHTARAHRSRGRGTCGGHARLRPGPAWRARRATLLS